MNQALAYPYEKFQTAIISMATMTGSLKERIHSAYMSFHPLSANDFNGELKTKYTSLMELLTTVKDGDERLGYVQNTLNAASPKKIREIADLIVEIYFDIESEYHAGNM